METQALSKEEIARINLQAAGAHLEALLIAQELARKKHLKARKKLYSVEGKSTYEHYYEDPKWKLAARKDGEAFNALKHIEEDIKSERLLLATAMMLFEDATGIKSCITNGVIVDNS